MRWEAPGSSIGRFDAGLQAGNLVAMCAKLTASIADRSCRQTHLPIDSTWVPVAGRGAPSAAFVDHWHSRALRSLPVAATRSLARYCHCFFTFVFKCCKKKTTHRLLFFLWPHCLWPHNLYLSRLKNQEGHWGYYWCRWVERTVYCEDNNK